jgi:hypothetical protein
MRALLVIALLAVASSPASAEKADKLFKKGKKLLAEKKYADACAAFEEVDKIEPGIGAKLNVARCFEEWGRLATAYRWYTDAETMATASKDDRATKIKELAAELDTNVPRVTIKVPEGANPDVLETLTIDGKPVARDTLGVEQRVDPGPHLIEFVVDGAKKKKMAPVERGGSSEVTLDIPKGVGKPKPKIIVKNPGDPDPDPETPPPPGRTQRIAGITLIATGGVAIGVASALTLSARGKYKDAVEEHCMGSTSMCSAEGLTITRDARSRANVATVITIAGGAAIIGGVVLYLIAPKAATDEEHALYLTPTVGDDGGGVVFGGRY